MSLDNFPYGTAQEYITFAADSANLAGWSSDGKTLLFSDMLYDYCEGHFGEAVVGGNTVETFFMVLRNKTTQQLSGKGSMRVINGSSVQAQQLPNDTDSMLAAGIRQQSVDISVLTDNATIAPFNSSPSPNNSPFSDYLSKAESDFSSVLDRIGQSCAPRWYKDDWYSSLQTAFNKFFREYRYWTAFYSSSLSDDDAAYHCLRAFNMMAREAGVFNKFCDILLQTIYDYDRNKCDNYCEELVCPNGYTKIRVYSYTYNPKFPKKLYVY
jgi:hypothetical protein